MRRIPILLVSVLALGACAKQGQKSSSNAAAPGAPAQPISFTQFQKQEASLAADKRLPAPNADTADCSATPGAAGDSSCQDLRQEFRYVVYVGKQIYCYWDEKKADTGRDFDAYAKELEGSITDKNTTSEYFLKLRNWASAFHDGHVNAMSGDDLSPLEIYSAPVRVEVLAPATNHEKVVVVALGDFTGKPIAKGDEITEVNGRPVADVLAEAAEKLSSGSTARMRRYAAARRLVDVVGAANAAVPFSFTVLHEGKPVVVPIPRKAELDLPPDANAKAADDDGTKAITVSVLPGGIGYIKINEFAGKMGALIDLGMDRLLPTKGLVIDVRQNGGGDQSGSKLIARLIESKVVRYKQSPRNSDFLLSQRPDLFLTGFDPSLPFAPWADVAVKPADPEKRYLHKPVVVLTSPYCFSACDTFVAGLHTNGLATVIGEGTGGGTGSPLVFPLPVSNMQFRYSVARGHTAKDEVIEGAGTLPDVYLEPTVSDRVAPGVDGQLDLALETVSKQAGVPMPPADSRPVSFVGQRLDISPTAADQLELKRLSAWEK